MIQLFQKIYKSAFCFDEALERQKLTREGVELLRVKLKSSKIVPKFVIDNQVKCCKHQNRFTILILHFVKLLLFLNSCDGDEDLAVKKLETYYDIKRSSPEFFANRDLESEGVQKCLDNLRFVALPVTSDNCNLILHQFKNPKPREYDYDDAIKTFIMKAEEYAYNNGPRSGTIFIDDLEGARIGHLFRPGLNSIRKSIRFLQEGSPLNVKAIHVMNTVPWLHMIIALIKPFMWSEMMNKIHFHPSNMDYKKFHEEFIPKSHLPSDYGGDLESIEQLHEQQRKTFMEMRDYFTMEERQKNHEFDEFAVEYEVNRKQQVLEQSLSKTS